MATTSTKTSEPAGFPRFRHAEQAVWDHYDLSPKERLVALDAGGVVRVHEVGVGEPIIFIHGSGGSGVYWAPLVTNLASEFRCILIDRPGWTLSTPFDYSTKEFAAIAADLQADLLDSLQIDTAHVIGGSIGNLFAMRFAQHQPERATSVVLLGGGPLTAESRPPTFIKLLRSPLGRVMVRIPQKPGMVRKQMEGLGHGTSVRQGLIPPELVNIYIATGRDTSAMHHERDLVRNIINRHGYVDGLTLTDHDLRSIQAPTTMIYGSDDPVGNMEVWQRFVEAMPNGDLHLLSDSGHLPWYDRPDEVASLIKRHVARSHL